MIEERSKRVKSFAPRLKNIGLVSYGGIRSHYFDPIDTLSQQYLVDCLEEQYQASFDVQTTCDKFLLKYEEEIRYLKNITPNGLCLPKQCNYLSYNRLHKKVAEYISFLGVNDYTHAHCPLNIRIIDGKNKSGIDRPRSSMKIHTDIWAGEPADSIMFHIQVAGDVKNNGINLWEPDNSIFPDYIKSFPDFNINKEIKSTKPYNVENEVGNIYFLDSYVLHQTFKNSNRLRLTIAAPMIYKYKLESDIAVSHDRHDEYIDKETWLEIGKNKLLYSGKAIDEYNKVDSPQNAYADKYKVCNLEKVD